MIKNADSIPLPQESRHNPQGKGYAPGRVPDKGNSGRGMLSMPVRKHYSESDIMRDCSECKSKYCLPECFDAHPGSIIALNKLFLEMGLKGKVHLAGQYDR